MNDELVQIADRLWTIAKQNTPPTPEQLAMEFTLQPPVGWLNRIDEVLRHHGVVTSDGSPLGEALGRLVRSWDIRNDPRNAHRAPLPKHWGPTAAELAHPTADKETA